MAETLTTTPESPTTAPAPSSAPASGQAAASASTPTAPDTSGSTVAPAQAPEAERTPAKKFRFKTQDEAERAHSELQGRYAKTLGDPEQAAAELALWRQVRQDKEFLDWAKARVAKQEAGSDDPETVKALQIVETVAERKARELIAPYAAQAAQARLAAVFQAMTQEHGAEWQEHRQKMAEVFQKGVQAGYFSPLANQNPTFEFVNHLYTLATNADPEFAAKQYQKRLAQKQAQATQSSPGPAPRAIADGPSKTLEAAFAAAKRAHGLA